MTTQQDNNRNIKQSKSSEERLSKIPPDRLEVMKQVKATVLRNIDVFQRLKDK